MRKSHSQWPSQQGSANQCQIVERIITNRPWVEMHRCNLPAAHYGKHLCWCGWSFGASDALYRQARIWELELKEPDSGLG
jgi:hypothetical protein